MIDLKRGTLFCLGFLAILTMGCGSDATVPNTPDGTILACAKGLADKNPGVIWNAMPASYQADVTGLVHDLAGKMDEDVYDKSFVLLNKAIGVMKDQRKFIMELIGSDPSVGMMLPDKEGLEKNWDNVVDLLAVLVDSDIDTVSSLKSLDVGSYVAKTGSRIMDKLEAFSSFAPQDEFNEIMRKLTAIQVTVLSVEGDIAKLQLVVEGEAPEEVEMTKVEGKWIPKDMAAEWKQMIEEAKTNIGLMTDEGIKQQKPMIMGMMAGIETVLDQLAEAKTSEEFAEAFKGFTEMMMGM